MIPLPTPPTDNVYKFMTISGVLIFAAAFIADAAFQTSLRETLRDVRMHNAIASDVLTSLEANERAIEQRTAHATRARDIAKGLSKDAAVDTLVASLIELKTAQELSDSMGTALSAFKKRNTEVNARLNVAVMEMHDYDRGRGRMLISAMLIGLILAGWGLWMWYDRVQRYHDLALRRESKSQSEVPRLGV
jgi:hypothetical protein